MEQTTCYKCDTEIQAPQGAVHALCSNCDTSFEDWFSQELAKLDGRAS
jgi:LSD1 subclass zinc finger protein